MEKREKSVSNDMSDRIEIQVRDSGFDTDPYPTLKILREQEPVHWSESLGGWMVTRYEDVVRTFKDIESFSNSGRLAQASVHLSPDAREGLGEFHSHYNGIGLLHSDPPEHSRLRRLVLEAFNPSSIRAMHDRVQQIVDEILDRASDVGGMEVINDLAWGLPSTVLADILGAPEESRQVFRKWADDLLAFQGSNKPSEEVLLTTQAALVDSRAYFSALIEERRRRPGNDLLSSLVQAQSEGDRLSEEELLNTCVTLLAAGQETTTALIGNALLLLLQRPDDLAAVRANRALIPLAIEEIVRFESPISRQPRLVRQEVELGGKRLAKGDVVFQMLNSANRDSSVFEEPDNLVIGRRPNRHIGFGLGAHYCVGAPLSRLEGAVVIDSLLNRFSEINIASETIVWNTSKLNSRILDGLEISLH